MDTNANAINWFEIPATDIDRAQKFYEAMNGKVSGGVVQGPMHTPAQNGVVVYLNANPSMQAVLDRIEPAGGKVVMPRTQISPEIGYMAFFVDTEGNRIGLHAQD